MILCLDSGNSRVKWGLRADGRWRAQGAVAHAEVGALAELAIAWPAPQRILLANVAGPAAADALRVALAAWPLAWQEVRSSAAAGGVRNHYQNPQQLGVDRWCALIAARRLAPGGALVVTAGTATTIDTLDATGSFLGGLILPGLALMRRALARETAGLPFANGHYAALPRCTDDAIVTGTLEAQAGAIERAWQRLANSDTCCLLSGGNAAVLAPLLRLPYRLVDNLPLEGLAVLAGD